MKKHPVHTNRFYIISSALTKRNQQNANRYLFDTIWIRIEDLKRRAYAAIGLTYVQLVCVLKHRLISEISENVCSALAAHDTSYWLGTVHCLLAIFLLLLIRLMEGLILIFSPDYYTIVQSIRMQNSQNTAWLFQNNHTDESIIIYNNGVPSKSITIDIWNYEYLNLQRPRLFWDGETRNQIITLCCR